GFGAVLDLIDLFAQLALPPGSLLFEVLHLLAQPGQPFADLALGPGPCSLGFQTWCRVTLPGSPMQPEEDAAQQPDDEEEHADEDVDTGHAHTVAARADTLETEPGMRPGAS